MLRNLIHRCIKSNTADHQALHNYNMCRDICSPRLSSSSKMTPRELPTVTEIHWMAIEAKTRI